MKTKDLVAEVTSLPIEERAIVADLILKSLNPTDTAIDQIWGNIAKRRAQEIRAGKVKLVQGDEVFRESIESDPIDSSYKDMS